MLSENEYKYSEPIFTEIEKKTSFKIIINFISTYILELPEICKKNNIDDEDFITQEFAILLMNKKNSEYPFNIYPQFIQKGKYKKKADISIIGYSDSNSIFDIECKRLPTPGYGREKEYIQLEEKGKGDYVKESGAIARFKKSLYSKDLSQCSIIGYVQERSFKEWFDTINNWIIEFSKIKNTIWGEDDKLFNYREDGKLALSFSENKRTDKSTIKIHHIWIMMN